MSGQASWWLPRSCSCRRYGRCRHGRHANATTSVARRCRRERPDRLLLRGRHLRRRSGYRRDDRDRHEPDLRGQSDVLSRRREDRVHSRRSANGGIDDRGGASRRFRRARPPAEGARTPGVRKHRLDARRRLAPRAARHAPIYVSLRRRRALAVRLLRHRGRTTHHAATCNVGRRPLLQRQHPRRADVPPARGRPHPVRRPKRAERVRS